MEAYQEDLAYVHDSSFGNFSFQAAPFIIETLRRNGITVGLVVDLGCGSGILARELLKAGYGLLGIDISEAMISMAREKAPGGRFHTSSYMDAEIPPCMCVTSVGECLCYLFDEENTVPHLFRLFKKIFRALRPGGFFIFDISCPGYLGGEAETKNFWHGHDWAMMTTFQESHHLLTREITLFRKVNGLYRRSREIHRCRLYRPAEIAAQLRKTGFTARIMRGYGSQRFKRAHRGIMARKPC